MPAAVEPRSGAPGSAAAPASLSVLLLALSLALAAGAAWPQTPDNRGVALDPDDPGTPAYRDTLEVRDRDRLEHALDVGETHIPLLTVPVRAPEPATPPVAPPPVVAPDPGPARARADGGWTVEDHGPRDGAGAGEAVKALLDAWSRPPRPVRLHLAPEAEPDGGDTAGPARDAASRPVPALFPGLVPGRGFHARVLYTVDSDHPGPVLLELLEPPLAGALASGAFTRHRHRLVLRLNRLEHRGRRGAVDGWGVGLDCACYAISGEVDRHLFARVLLPAAIAFAGGFLEAAGQAAETLTVGADQDIVHRRSRTRTRDHLYAGGATAAEALGRVLLEEAPRGPTVRLPRDTELVVVFTGAGEDGRRPTRERDGERVVPARASDPAGGAAGEGLARVRHLAPRGEGRR